MKSLIITDMHGKDPIGLVEYHVAKGVERLVCLGDYDIPQVLEKIRKLNMPKILLVGNHDYHHVTYRDIKSKLMRLSREEYEDLWDDYPAEKDFIKEAIAKNTQDAGIIVTGKAGKRNLVYVHASLLDWDAEETGLPHIWGRFVDESKIVENFRAMQKQNYDIMFKGHDHVSRVLTRAKTDTQENPVVLERGVSFEPNPKVLLGINSLHIVSVGAFYQGEYAIFDDKKAEVTFFRDAEEFRRQGP